MGTDLPRLLNPLDPDAPSAAAAAHHRAKSFSLPRLEALDAARADGPPVVAAGPAGPAAPSPAAVAVPSSAISAISAAASFSARDRAGLQQQHPHSRPGPQLTPPPSSSSSRHDPPAGLSSSLPASSWTAVNRPLGPASFDESRGTGNHSRDPASYPFGQPRQTPPQATAFAPQPAQPGILPSAQAQHHLQHQHHDAARHSPTAFRSARQDSAVAIPPACSTQPRLPESASPNFAYFDQHSNTLHPATPPSPAPSPTLDSQASKPAVPPSLADHPPPPKASEGLTSFVPAIWTGPDSFQPHHPANGRRRSNSVRFADQHASMSMMPPPSTVARHGDPATRDTPNAPQPQAQALYSSHASLPHAGATTSDDVPMTGVVMPSSSSTDPAPVEAISHADGGMCQDCYDMNISSLSSLDSELKRRHQKDKDVKYEDYAKNVESLITTLRNLRERGAEAREACKKCGTTAENMEQKITITLSNRTNEPMDVILRNEKRKSPSEDRQSEAESASKSRKTTPGSPFEELCEYTPPPEAEGTSKKGPRYSLANAEGIFSSFTEPLPQQEEIPVDSPFARLEFLHPNR